MDVYEVRFEAKDPKLGVLREIVRREHAYSAHDAVMQGIHNAVAELHPERLELRLLHVGPPAEDIMASNARQLEEAVAEGMAKGPRR